MKRFLLTLTLVINCILSPVYVSAQEKVVAEVFDVDQMLFNGKLKRYFSYSEFQKVFGEADSVNLLTDVQPCSYIFENEDGSKDAGDSYLYKDGSTFEKSKEKVAVDEFRFSKNNYLLYKGKKLDGKTSLEDLKKLFPNAVKSIYDLKVYKEGILQVIQLREDENNVSDGHIKIFMKDGYLYSMHWWFPC